MIETAKTLADKVLMIRPASFAFNDQTSSTNEFQNKVDFFSSFEIQDDALLEFDNFVSKLNSFGIETVVYNDTKEPKKPDAVFPNNWLVAMPDKKLFTFPMLTKNRSIERRSDILESLEKQGYKIDRSLEDYENVQKFLEGTGSMVMDHEKKIIYAAISPRTNEELLNVFADKTGYSVLSFQTNAQSGIPVYHTNVVMSLGSGICVICRDIIAKEDLNVLDQSLKDKMVIEISVKQAMESYAGNCLFLSNREGRTYFILSANAYRSLKQRQIEQITSVGVDIIRVPLSIIERIGGGSARCMLAELF